MNRFTLILLILFLGSLANPASAIDDTPSIKGTKLLVAFSPYRVNASQRAAFEKAMNDKEIKVVKKYHYNQYFLVDCGMNAKAVLERIPYHAGAIAFNDGHFVKSYPTADKKQTPKPHVILNWGSSQNGIQKMKKDIAKFSNMKGIKATKIDLSKGKPAFGNPFMLKLTPEKGKTLLDVFLLAEGQFDYTAFKKK